MRNEGATAVGDGAHEKSVEYNSVKSNRTDEPRGCPTGVEKTAAHRKHHTPWILNHSVAFSLFSLIVAGGLAVYRLTAERDADQAVTCLHIEEI